MSRTKVTIAVVALVVTVAGAAFLLVTPRWERVEEENRSYLREERARIAAERERSAEREARLRALEEERAYARSERAATDAQERRRLEQERARRATEAAAEAARHEAALREAEQALAESYARAERSRTSRDAGAEAREQAAQESARLAAEAAAEAARREAQQALAESVREQLSRRAAEARDEALEAAREDLTRGSVAHDEDAADQQPLDEASTRDTGSTSDDLEAAFREAGEAPLPSDAPVYNAEFTPHAEGAPNVLEDAVPTTVAFYIGPRSPVSAIAPSEERVSPRILEQAEDALPLTVTMSCWVCEAASLQTSRITYRRAAGRSDHAIFEILPLRTLTADQGGRGEIAFTVAGQGVEYDHLVVGVQVRRGAEQVAVPASRVASFSEPPAEAPWDLAIRVEQSPAGPITVSLQPLHDGLAHAFGNAHLDPADPRRLRYFHTGVSNMPELYADLRETYTTLRTLVEGGERDLLRQYDTDFPRPSGAEIKLSEALGEQFVQALYTSGATLYAKLFSYGEGDLKRLMRTLDDFDWGSRTVRVRIETKGIYLPWQLLHPAHGARDWERFWGFRYALSARPLLANRPGRLSGAMTGLDSSGATHLGYLAASGDDAVTRLSAWHAELIGEQLDGNGIETISSRAEFRDRLKERAGALKLLSSFTHGTSGTTIRRTPKGRFAYVFEIAGSRLRLSENEPAIQPTDLIKLTLGEDRELFFPNQPLVFLNGCETGTSGAQPTTDESFPGNFIRLGARGVVVTEAPIWMFFGYHFGNDLMREVFAGQELAVAMRAVRRRHMELSRNPLGLLYAYYGNGAARIVAKGAP